MSNLIPSIRQGLSLFLIGAIVFVLVEPAVSLGATSATNQFTISQTITKEVSISSPATNVTLSPSLGGLTGGVANGSTQVIVVTNDTLGYTMTIQASSTGGMYGNASSTNFIPVYVPATPGVPDFNFVSSTNKANFGYTVEASTTADIAQSFRDNGTSCNQAAGGETGSACWLGATSTAFVIIKKNFPTPSSGSTSTIKFRVAIIGTPNPLLPDDTYVATTTLTMTSN